MAEVSAEPANTEMDKRSNNNISRLRAMEKSARSTGAALLAGGTLSLGLGAAVVINDETKAARHENYTYGYYQEGIDLELATVVIAAVAIGGGAYRFSQAGRYGQQANLLEVGYELNPLPPDAPAEQGLAPTSGDNIG